MRYSPLLALGLGNVVLAQSNSTTFSWSSRPTASPTPTPGPDDDDTTGFPSRLGDFDFYGCVSSTDGFPTFQLMDSDDNMSLGLCAASCPSRFMGVYNTDCYCGETIDGDDTQRVANSLCDTECPGNDNEFCGGMAGNLALARRQSVPLSVLLTVYIRIIDGDDDGDATATVTATGSTTITETVTTTGTVTACPDGVTDCPIGQATTATFTTTYCPAPTPVWEEKVIICYGDFCAPQTPCHEDKCAKHRVVCQDGNCFPEECQEGDHHGNKLVECKGEDCHYTACHGDECQKKVVCYGDHCINSKCYGDECNKNYVCHGDECGHEQCEGDECYQEISCDGENCNPVPPCSDNCPVPPVPLPTPIPGPCEGPECPIPTGGIPPVKPENPDVPVGGSGKTLPALGMGAVAGLAFFL